MVKFIHLSDLHIGKRKGKTENKNCEKIRDYIIGKYGGDPETVVLITGDIVDDGEEKQYKNAVSILKPLTAHFKVLACPGNHDYGPCGNFYEDKAQMLFQKYILGELLGMAKAKKPGMTMEKIYPTRDVVGDVLFVGVDSVVGKEDEFGHFASGEVGKPQRTKLAKVLKQNGPEDKRVVVYFHHHPLHYNSGIGKTFMAMADAEQVLRILATQSDFVCFGHRHKSQMYTPEEADVNIEYIMASGKTPKRNQNGNFKYREGQVFENGIGVKDVILSL